MRKRCIVLVLVVSAFTYISAQLPAPKSDREKSALVGPVAKIKVEITSHERKDKKWIESERLLLEEVEYDRAGTQVRSKRIPAYGDPKTCQDQYKYDKKKRPTVKFCMDGSSERVLEKYAYQEDRHGNWIKRVASVPDGGNFRPQLILYRQITYFN